QHDAEHTNWKGGIAGGYCVAVAPGGNQAIADKAGDGDMAELTIYIGNKNYSSWSLRAWLALKQSGAMFEEVVIPLDRTDSTANLRRHSPNGRVPVLQDGELTIWDSLAICEYLAEQFPAARLWPEHREPRAQARAISNEMHAGFAALRWTSADVGR